MLQVAGVLGSDEVERLRSTLAEVPFRDGRATAGAAARKVKSNEQAAFVDERV